MSLLKKMKQKVHNKGGYTQDASVFPFWNADYGSTSTIRLIPRIDEISNVIWTERHTIPMTFVDPENDSKTIVVYAPCMTMYGESCPIKEAVTGLYREADEAKKAGDPAEEERLRAVAGKHWLKSTFYYQGFVNQTDYDEKGTPENPIRVFPVSKKLHNKIKADIFGMDEGDAGIFEDLPSGEFTLDDIEALVAGENVNEELFNGFDLILKKAKQGEYADWTSQTTWARKETPLTEDQITALAEHGYQDTSKKLPEHPNEEQMAVYEEMIQVSIDRLLNGGDGYWDSEWEKAGIKRPNVQGGKGGVSGGAKASPKASKPAPRGEAVSSEVVTTLKKRGAKKATASTEDVADDASAQADTAEAEAPTAPSAKRESLKDRLKKRKAAEAA